MPGKLITFEGIDGSGKSLQACRLYQKLQATDRQVLILRDPGATRISEQIRTILLNRDHMEMSAWTELLLYEAARAQMVEEVIKPALTQNVIVLCDRFYDSTTAYQGYGRKLDLDLVQAANKLGACGLIPNLTFLLDLEPELALKRKHGSNHQNDRMESEDIEFYHRVRNGFLDISHNNPGTMKIINGNNTVTAIEKEIWAIVENYFF